MSGGLPSPQPLVSRAGRFLVLHEESFTGVPISSNVYVLESERFYVFDAGGRPDLAPFLRACGIEEGRIGAIFLTHGHYDHVTGLRSLRQFEVPTFISVKDAALLESSVQGAGAIDVSSDEPARILESIGMEKVDTPGHTPGSVCYLSKPDRTLISGDTVFSEGFFGRTDLPGGSDEQMIASLETLSRMGIDAILPGHGTLTTEGGSETIKAALSNARCLLVR